MTLPDEVLLEIFDLYRQSFGDELSSERVWNNKNGWFKLAHVCRNWRSIVLASPSRLRLRIFFAHNTPTRAVALERFSHLPIVVNYTDLAWDASAQNLKRLASALRYPDRVCRIAIRGSHKYPEKISEGLGIPFPALESLELHNIYHMKPTTLAMSLMASIHSLRHLQLIHTTLATILPLLSVTRALVDLTLTFDTALCQGASLLTHLQNMPHLRNLQVSPQFYHAGEMPPTVAVTLAKLTCFRFFGQCVGIEWFVAGLVTPSLRELHISVMHTDHTSHALHMPCLSKFIRVTGIFFFAAQLTISGPRLTTSLFAHPHSADAPPSKMDIRTQLGVRPGSGLSAILATLEDIFLPFSEPYMVYGLLLGKFQDVPWRKFFEVFRNVKVLRLHHGLETEVEEILRQPAIDCSPPRGEVDPDATTPSDASINNNRSQFSWDILPSLEEIVVYARTPDTSIGEKERASAIESFGSFVTARQEAGRPVKVCWNTDEVPRYFMEGRVDACTMQVIVSGV